MNTEALKQQARRHEQREEWLKAIEQYARAVDELAREDQPDLSLYNRLGDLEIRVGHIERGVEYYEKAIDLYVESELPNNAIAICRKIVRNLPTRHSIFLKMGQIRARQGFLTDARTNFLEYAERMQKADDLDEALRALVEFVDLAPEDVEARSVLAAFLEAQDRKGEALDQYVAIHQRLTLKDQTGDAQAIEEKIRDLDPDAVIPSPRPGGLPLLADEASEDEAFGFETTSLVEDFPTLETPPEPVAGEAGIDAGAMEITPLEADEEEEPVGHTGGGYEPELELEHGEPFEAPDDLGQEPLPLVSYHEEYGEEEPWVADTVDREVTAADVDEPDLEVAAADVDKPDLEIAADDVDESGQELVAADFGERDDPHRDQEYLEPAGDVPELEAHLGEIEESDESAEPDEGGWEESHDQSLPPAGDEGLVKALQARLEVDADDSDTWLALAKEFQALDRSDEASLALAQAMQRLADKDDLDGLIRASGIQVTLEPDSLEYRQRLVELASRRGDAELLTSAYLDLAQCLVRVGNVDQARAVYEQVLITDPDNLTALDGLGALVPAAAPPVREVASSEDYVDLGSLILDEEEERTTRWKVADEPSGDEAADFARMLTQFKEKVAENVGAEDLAAHYDLGTAYKEMGLVDEAIYEFQQALRAESTHLPTHELLGQCFMEKGQYEVAVRSMNRALDSNTEVEDELLGIYYQMARAHEELGNKGEALEFYEKVFALDINFQDVTERLRDLR